MSTNIVVQGIETYFNHFPEQVQSTNGALHEIPAPYSGIMGHASLASLATTYASATNTVLIPTGSSVVYLDYVTTGTASNIVLYYVINALNDVDAGVKLSSYSTCSGHIALNQGEIYLVVPSETPITRIDFLPSTTATNTAVFVDWSVPQ